MKPVKQLGLIWLIFFLLSFLAQKVLAATPPTLIEPISNQTTTDTSPTLSWSYTGECPADASCFKVEVDDLADFSSLNKYSYTNSFNYTPQSLGFGVWYWRVKAKDISNVWSEYSEVRSFEVVQVNNSLVSPTPLATTGSIATASPKPSPTPKQTATPKPSKTPIPTKTPKPTPSPKAVVEKEVLGVKNTAMPVVDVRSDKATKSGTPGFHILPEIVTATEVQSSRVASNEPEIKIAQAKKDNTNWWLVGVGSFFVSGGLIALVKLFRKH